MLVVFALYFLKNHGLINHLANTKFPTIPCTHFEFDSSIYLSDKWLQPAGFMGHNANGHRWFQSFFFFCVGFYIAGCLQGRGEKLVLVWKEKTWSRSVWKYVSQQHPTPKKHKTYNFGSALGSESHKLTQRQEYQEYACSYVKLLNCQPQINFANHKALLERLIWSKILYRLW